MLLPYRRPKIYEASPIKWGGKTGLAFIGVLGVVANLVLDWMILTAPADSYNILAPTSDNWFANRLHSTFGHNRSGNVPILQVRPQRRRLLNDLLRDTA